jgi:YEATS domain-containing protein 4
MAPEPEPAVCKRMQGTKISIPIVIGSIAQAIKRPIIVPGYDW